MALRKLVSHLEKDKIESVFYTMCKDKFYMGQGYKQKHESKQVLGKKTWVNSSLIWVWGKAC